MKNWTEFTIYEQVEIVIRFLKSLNPKLQVSEQYFTELFLYSFGKMPSYISNTESLVSIEQIDTWLIESGLKEWFIANNEELSNLSIKDNKQGIDNIFWKEGWIVTSNGNTHRVERIDDAASWKIELELPFTPTQLNNDLEAVELAKKHGFRFDDLNFTSKITNRTSPK